jgi:hypothetical protein
MTAVIDTERLGKRYRQLWALTDCTLSVPAGHVVGLVGQTGLPEMLGTRECRIAVLNWGNGYGRPTGPCYYARL